MHEKLMQMQEKAKNLLLSFNVEEVRSSSCITQELMDAANIDGDSWERDFVEQKNPEDGSKTPLPTVLMPSMLEILGRDYTAGIEEKRAFEIAETFTKNYVIPDAAPFTCWNLSLGLYGPEEDLSTLAEVITGLLEQLGIADVDFLVEKSYGTYHPEQCARIVTRDYSGQEVELGIMGEIHPQVKENFGIDAPAYGAELFFDLILEFADRAAMYHQSITQPSATIDAEILSAEAAQLDELEKQIRALFGTGNLES